MKSAVNRVLTLSDYSTRGELSIDVLYVTRASIYAELRLKQVRMQNFRNNSSQKALNRVLTLPDYRARRELSIDVLYVTRASIYAELRLKQVCM